MINSVSIKTAVSLIIVISVGILLFLIWLIYIKDPVTDSNFQFISYLPIANAIFNATGARVRSWPITAEKVKAAMKGA